MLAEWIAEIRGGLSAYSNHLELFAARYILRKALVITLRQLAFFFPILIAVWCFALVVREKFGVSLGKFFVSLALFGAMVVLIIYTVKNIY